MKQTSERSIPIYLDTTSNLINSPIENKAPGFTKNRLLLEYKSNIDVYVNRYKELPPIVTFIGPYTQLLKEARQLYVEGMFYSCVTMCGVTAETIAKDIFKKKIFFKKSKYYQHPNAKTNEVLDRINMSLICKILFAEEIIDKTLCNSFEKLAKLRNKYAHGSGKNAKEDCLKAIKYLHEIVEDTISIFIDYRIKNGKLVLKKKEESSY